MRSVADLQVQRIKNTFTVEVYEIHARIALEAASSADFPHVDGDRELILTERPRRVQSVPIDATSAL